MGYAGPELAEPRSAEAVICIADLLNLLVHRRRSKGTTKHMTACCGEHFMGTSRKSNPDGKFFKNSEHYGRYLSNQMHEARRGPFLEIVNKYLSGYAREHYRTVHKAAKKSPTPGSKTSPLGYWTPSPAHLIDLFLSLRWRFLVSTLVSTWCPPSPKIESTAAKW